MKENTISFFKEKTFKAKVLFEEKICPKLNTVLNTLHEELKTLPFIRGFVQLYRAKKMDDHMYNRSTILPEDLVADGLKKIAIDTITTIPSLICRKTDLMTSRLITLETTIIKTNLDHFLLDEKYKSEETNLNQSVFIDQGLNDLTTQVKNFFSVRYIHLFHKLLMGRNGNSYFCPLPPINPLFLFSSLRSFQCDDLWTLADE